MSDSNSRKRNLPSWMGSNDDDGGETSKQPRNHGKSKEQKSAEGEEKVGSGTKSIVSDFSRLMESVVFVLSGFVNPERSILRSQMLEMGAEYQQDWNSSCTLLVCAFFNTPKFRQVKADGGTIISKDWIAECYNNRKLVDIETYLMHTGKPWRKQAISQEAEQDAKPSISSKSLKQEDKAPHSKKAATSSPNPKTKKSFSASTVKKWAVEDLKKTVSWLENQDEKPEPSQIKKIAAEGILTCVQDAIDAFKQGQGLQHIIEQWSCLPRLVEQLSHLDDSASSSKDELCREAMLSKQIYELEFLNMENNDVTTSKKPQSIHNTKSTNQKKNVARDDTSYDSDGTIEMTEEEIDRAYNTIGSSI